MNKLEHLLVCVAEECAEVQQAVTKMLRFGWDDINPSNGRTALGHCRLEIADLLAVLEMLKEAEHGYDFAVGKYTELMKSKKQRVEGFMAYARKRGTLKDSSCPQP